MDSIRGFGSLDPGSNPGTSACFDPRAYEKNPRKKTQKEQQRKGYNEKQHEEDDFEQKWRLVR